MGGRNDDASAGGRSRLLAALFTSYSRPLTRFFARRVPVPADVPDLVQDVFLRLSRMPDPATMEQPDRFVFVTAANVLRDRARRQAVRPELAPVALDDLAAIGSEIPVDRVLDSKRVAERMAATLRKLPERTRDVFVLRYLEGWKMAEVAQRLGVSTRAAEKHQARALALLAAALEDWRS